MDLAKVVRFDQVYTSSNAEFNKATESMSVRNCKELYRVGKELFRLILSLI